MKHKKSASVAVAPTASETPKYAPWDRMEFLKRLKSFSNLTDWTPKPAKVNEVEWAKRGWVCQKSERVRCCLCNVEILVKLNKKEVDGKEVPVYVPGNIEDALVDKYAELIITSHSEDCLWRKRGCDDSIFKLPLTNAANTIQALKERYQELVARRDNLPYTFNMRTPDGFDLDLVLSYIPKGFFESASESSDASLPVEINKVAFLMALFGWQGHSRGRLGPELGSSSCHACYRVLGLWLFKSKSVNEAGEEVTGPIVNGLGVALEHRDYCPWRNAVSQNGQNPTVKSSTNIMAGWEIIVRVLKNEFQLRASREPPRPRTPRTVMDENSVPMVDEVDDEDARSIRDEKDKERWVRLRRVKSLFETKAGKKLHRPGDVTKQNT